MDKFLISVLYSSLGFPVGCVFTLELPLQLRQQTPCQYDNSFLQFAINVALKLQVKVIAATQVLSHVQMIFLPQAYWLQLVILRLAL